jgi:hypothetical protein
LNEPSRPSPRASARFAKFVTGVGWNRVRLVEKRTSSNRRARSLSNRFWITLAMPPIGGGSGPLIKTVGRRIGRSSPPQNWK